MSASYNPRDNTKVSVMLPYLRIVANQYRPLGKKLCLNDPIDWAIAVHKFLEQTKFN
jgi:hypothetical protein